MTITTGFTTTPDVKAVNACDIIYCQRFTKRGSVDEQHLKWKQHQNRQYNRARWYDPAQGPQATDTNDQRKVEAIERCHQQAQRLLEPRRAVITFAQHLTFRTDQIRYRRDHAKYLSLIASLALLHQYQRKRVTHESESCVVATLGDVRVANRLA